MTARIDIIAPATATAFGGGASSLESAPPGGVVVSDPGGGTITLTIIAGHAGASLSASSLGGATVSSNGGTLTITGIGTQVNAALASLAFFEPSGTTTDTISFTATETGELSASTALALNVAPTTGPAFVAPPHSLSLAAWSLDTIGGLFLADPAAQALVAAGQGATEAMEITISVASGFLVLPGYSAIGGIGVTGVGTGQMIIYFTADQLAAVNALLAGLAYAGPAGMSGLAYAMHDESGPLGAASTSGNIVLNVAGSVGATSTITSGADTVILGTASLGAGTLTVRGDVSDLGGIAGGTALYITPDAMFQVPYNGLALGGTSYDFGTLSAATLTETGALLVADGASFGGAVSLGGGALIDFSGTLITAGAAKVAYQQGLSLAAGAVITGSGTLMAGNFSEAGRIFGPGTIIAEGGGTLLIAAAEVSGGAMLEVGAGAVLELGLVDPLFGIFDATPLTIDAGVTLDFLGEAGADSVTGGFADALDQRGGVIVIESPDVFNGTIIGFAPGDRLVFPALSGLTLLSITSQSFVIAGLDGDGDTVEYTIDAAIPVGTQAFVFTDAQGDGEVGLRDSQVDIFLGASAASAGVINAQLGVAQPVLGLDVLLTGATNQALTLTLSVGHGMLSDGSGPGAATLILTAATAAALNAELAALTYTGSIGFTADTLNIYSGTGVLAGVSAAVAINISLVGGLVTGFGDAGQTAWLNGTAATPILLTGAAAPGAVLVTGTYDLADALVVPGILGNALRVDAGGVAMFDGAAVFAAAGDVVLGDVGGAGLLGVLTNSFSADNATIGGNGVVEDFGAITLSGSLSDAGRVDLAGRLNAAAVSIAAGGGVYETGGGVATFGGVTDAGVLSLVDQAAAHAVALAASGTLLMGGTAQLYIQNGTTLSGAATIGPDAGLTAGSLAQTAGTLLLDGKIAAQSMTLDGSIALVGGTIEAAGAVLSNGALSGFGEIEGFGTLAKISLTGEHVLATGGELVIGGNLALAGGSTMTIGAGAGLDIVHGMNGGTIMFGGVGAELTVNDLGVFSSPVVNMVGRDAIDLVGVAPSLVTFAAGEISAMDGQGHGLGSFALSIAAGQPAVMISSDGHGGALITMGGEMPCFARGTRILTPNGYVPVETIAPGDPVIGRGGASRAVVWVGRRTLDFAADPAGHPVRFAAGALGPKMPARPVKISPLHAVFLDGVLVPALHLVNGATITHEPVGAVTYYHIELARHDVVLADGMPAESYLDAGNRGALYRERGVRGECRTACAQIVTGGPRLAAIRRRLHGIALEAGYVATYDAGLRGVAGTQALVPEIVMRRGRRVAVFNLPRHAARLRLAARAAMPAETDPDCEDRRQLGICLEALPRGVQLGPGWLGRAAGDAGTWMGGAGEILLPRSRAALALPLAAVVRRWRAPVDGRGAGG